MLWFVVNTDLTITTEKLVELFATMEDVWMDAPYFGLPYQLDLPGSKVDKMKRNYRSPSRRRDAYLDLYATGHPCPSWRQVAEVLRGVNLYHQADVVESTYVQGTRIIPIHSLFDYGRQNSISKITFYVCVILECQLQSYTTS